MKNFIIFDLDGTLLDTLGDLHAAVNHALMTEDLPTRSLDEVRCFVGNGIRRLVERSVPENCDKAVLDRVFAEFKRYYSAHTTVLTKAYDGIPALLRSLKAAGAKLGVVTNKSDAPAKVLMEHFFPGVFDSVVGEREGVRKKPAPDSVLETLRIFGGSPSEAVYIGDSEVDVRTAENAGCELIAVTWGFRSRERLLSEGAATLADSPEELLQILR